MAKDEIKNRMMRLALSPFRRESTASESLGSAWRKQVMRSVNALAEGRARLSDADVFTGFIWRTVPALTLATAILAGAVLDDPDSIDDAIVVSLAVDSDYDASTYEAL